MRVGERSKAIWSATALSLLAAASAGALFGMFGMFGMGASGPVAGLVAAIVLAGAFLAMLPRWHRLDHMERDGRLLSWYWGGGFGGGLALLLALALGGARSPLFTGAALVWLLQCAGYAAWRLGWWLRHRGAA